LLLLIILIVVLLVVLLRGRETPEEELVTGDYEPAYSPSPGWTSERTAPGTPIVGTSTEGRTEVAAPDWPVQAPGSAPLAPVSPAVGGGMEIPESGGTRIIERAPKHLAMLVDKTRPDRKYDLKGTTNIGRASDNHIVLDDPTVSRHHAWIRAEGERFLVFDIGSGNGTFVNDVQIEEPHGLQNGDNVRFGDATFIFTQVF
jgi:hypothetical protein